MRDLRLPIIALIAVLTAMLLAAPALAQQTTVEELPPILVEVDQWIDNNLAEMSKRQDIYYQNNRGYWQGLTTHAVDPTYDEFTTLEQAAKEPDRFQEKPTDQDAGWADVFPEFGVEKLPA